jgi:hypothetical protein
LTGNNKRNCGSGGTRKQNGRERLGFGSYFEENFQATERRRRLLCSGSEVFEKIF